MSTQPGRAVVHSELDEGVQEVAVQVGELLPGADLLQVVRSDHQEVTEGVECVEELQHQRDLRGRERESFQSPVHLDVTEKKIFRYIYFHLIFYP